ncbi:MAG: phage major capsid protein [candidate division WOR-3 bacterium]
MEMTKGELTELLRKAVREAMDERLRKAYSPEPENPHTRLADIVRAMAFRDSAKLKTLTSGETPFLPTGISNEVIKAAELGASVRPGATLHRVAESTGRVPVARPSLTAYWVSEDTEPPAESEPAFGYLAWNLNKLKAYTKVTVEALEDSSVDIGAEIADSLGRAIRYTEESAFWLGDGTGKPSGIDGAIPASWVIDATGKDILDVLNEMYVKLPPEFRESAAWYANSATKALLLGLEDTTGRPLLVPSLSGAFSWTVYGRPVHEASVLADGDIYLGDMRFYHIFERNGLELRVITEDEDLALKDEVLITITERIDGKLAWDTDGGITPFVKAENLGQ